MDTQGQPDTLLRLRPVLARTGLSRSVMYREIQAGRFPHPAKIGPKSAAWSARDVAAWIEERADQARERRRAILRKQAAPMAPTTPKPQPSRIPG
jgi:prophage regulatory protein